MCSGKHLHVVIDLLLRHPGQVRVDRRIAEDAVNVLGFPHYALLVLLEVLKNGLLNISAHLGRQEVHDLCEVFGPLDHLVLVLGVSPDQHLDPVIDLLEIGSEHVCITLLLGDQLVLDLFS